MAIDSKNIVDNDFWINIAAERIYSGTDRVKDSAERLQKVIVWVFGVYSTITFAGIIWGKKEDWNGWSLLGLGIGFVLMIFSYWQSSLACFSIKQKLNANEPASIEDAYNNLIIITQGYFKGALVLCSLGIAFYCIGLLIQFATPTFSMLFGKEKVKIEMAADSLSAKVLPIKNQNAFALNVRSKKNTWVKLRLEYDTLIKNRQITKPVYPPCDVLNHETWVFIDSTAAQNLNVKYRRHNNMFIVAIRTDTLKSKTSYKTFTVRELIAR